MRRIFCSYQGPVGPLPPQPAFAPPAAPAMLARKPRCFPDADGLIEVVGATVEAGVTSSMMIGTLISLDHWPCLVMPDDEELSNEALLPLLRLCERL